MATFRCTDCGRQVVTNQPKPPKDKRGCKSHPNAPHIDRSPDRLSTGAVIPRKPAVSSRPKRKRPK